MEVQNYISIKQFCQHYELPVSFIKSLHEFDFIEIIAIEREHYIKKTEIQLVERIMRLHYDLDINMEGIDAIHNLLERVEYLQNYISELKNRLQRYEGF